MNKAKSYIRFWLAGLLAFLIGFNAMTLAAKSEEEASKTINFTLKDQNGKDVSLSDFKGKIVVLEWVNPDCPFTKRHYSSSYNTAVDLVKHYKDKPVVWLSINSTNYFDQEKNKAWHKENNLKHIVLDDSSGKVGKQFGAKSTPHVFVVDAAGKLAYEGAFDNDPRGSKPKTEQVNYVKQVVDALLSGNEPPIKESKPYGCSVKYKQ